MNEFSEAITLNECSNAGLDIHLYFNPQIGYYTAFGVSAFLADHIINGMKSFSDEFQMPVMIVSPGEIASLRNTTEEVCHEQRRYCHFRLRHAIGLDGYVQWVKKLKSRV